LGILEVLLIKGGKEVGNKTGKGQGRRKSNLLSSIWKSNPKC